MALYSNMALKATQGDTPYKYLGVINDDSENQGYLEYSTEAVLTKNAKFVVEYYKKDMVHIRSCLTNKYWVRSSNDGHWIVAKGAVPVVDQSSWTCTLFRMDMEDDENTKFHHVQSGRTICIPNDGSVRKMFLSIDPAITTEAVSFVVDYDTLVILPKKVAFRDTKGQLFESMMYGGCFMPDLEISNSNVVWEISYTNEGHIRVLNFAYDSCCWTNEGEPDDIVSRQYVDLYSTATRLEQRFTAIKINKNVVAFRNLGNKQICRRAFVHDTYHELKGESLCTFDRLIARGGLVMDSHLELVEPVIRRTVDAYEFDLDNARIYDVTLLYSKENVWDNYTDEKQSGRADATIKTTKSRSFSNTITVSASVDTSFKASIPFIAKGHIECSVTTSFAHQWGETTEETQEVGDSFTVVVVPMKRTIARGVATKGTCDVPFSYVQKDYPIDGGRPIVTKLYDGVFTGANAYSFHDEVRYEELPPHSSDQAPTECVKVM